ncbi:MAG: hypothetical protein WB866_15000 [Solirubrobacterales bacterium]
MDFQSKKQSENGMHCCPNCDSILVQPVSWHEQGDGWNVELRCPECEWSAQSSYSQDEVDRYEDEIDRGDQELMQDLRAIIRANMSEEAERFVTGLATDSILPEDFNASGGLA